MNAFLAVKTFTYPINSYDDILDSDFDLVVWKGTIWEDLYKLAPSGSLFKSIYHAKVKDFPGMKELGGSEETLALVEKGETLYGGSLAPLFSSNKYPCKVQDIPSMR